jgi:hypothetical protein
VFQLEESLTREVKNEVQDSRSPLQVLLTTRLLLAIGITRLRLSSLKLRRQ